MFAMVNVEMLQLVDDIKPILKAYVVCPKNVNADNATSTLRDVNAGNFLQQIILLSLCEI
jgi:hypothetical protein